MTLTPGRHLHEGSLIIVPLFNEPMRVETVRANGDGTWILGVVTPTLEEPIKDPARFAWREVTKVAHYRLEKEALTLPLKVREHVDPYGVLGR